MVRLKRLKVHRLRHVEPETELHFGDSFNVLLGKNATGKTTLLELVNAVLNDDFTGFLGERRGFDIEYDLVLGDGAATITCRLTREPLPESELGDGISPLALRSQRGEGRARESGSISWREGQEAWQCTIEQRTVQYSGGAGERTLELARDASSGMRWEICKGAKAHALLLGFGSPVGRDLRAAVLEDAPRFDEADGFLAAIGAPSLYEYDSGGSGDPLMLFAECWPFELLAHPRDHLGPDGNSLLWKSSTPVLQDIASMLGFDAMEVLTNLKEKGEDETLFEKPRFLFQASQHKVVHSLLSFGQRRFFAFLWYLAVRKRLPIVADELVNGFHHEWIAQCVDRLRGRQSFLATQNPLLLDDLPVTGLDEPATTFVRCESRRAANGEILTWRVFSEEENLRVAQARQLGIQSISETLRFEGLW